MHIQEGKKEENHRTRKKIRLLQRDDEAMTLKIQPSSSEKDGECENNGGRLEERCLEWRNKTHMYGTDITKGINEIRCCNFVSHFFFHLVCPGTKFRLESYLLFSFK
jgi:hypothetical protein